MRDIAPQTAQATTPPNDHRSTLLPLETWQYHSPRLYEARRLTDVGLLAEALLYYDRIYLDVTQPGQIQDIMEWAIREDSAWPLIRLIEDGVVCFHYHAFLTAPGTVTSDAPYGLIHIQTLRQSQPHSFLPEVVNKLDISMLSGALRRRLCAAIAGHTLESKADDYGPPLADANEALQSAERCALLVQALLDESFRRRKLGKPPTVTCEIVRVSDDTWTIFWQPGLAHVAHLIGDSGGIPLHLPISGEAHSNRLIWTAARNGLDIFLGEVMSTLVGNRLEASGQRFGRVGQNLDQLKERVEFPDVRSAVNADRLSLGDVLRIREEASSFRKWLQQTGDRDYDAIIAYHHEAAERLGITKPVGTALTVFGMLMGLGSGIASAATGDPLPAEIGAGVGAPAVSFLGWIASRLGSEWRPVVFGDWLRGELNEDEM